MDVGQCESNSCYGGPVTECTNTHTHCCGVTAQTRVDAQCSDNTVLPVYIVTSCGCTECASQSTVTVVGIAGDRNGTALRNGTIYVDGVFATRTSDLGQFVFEVDRGLDRVSILFVDTIDRYFTDNSYILQMPSANQDSVSIRVNLLPRGNVTTFSANETTTLTSGDTEIIIPENAFYTQDGQLHTVKLRSYMYS